MITPSLFDEEPEPIGTVTVSPSGNITRPAGPKPWLAAYCNHKWKEEHDPEGVRTLRCEGLCECSFPDWRKK